MPLSSTRLRHMQSIECCLFLPVLHVPWSVVCLCVLRSGTSAKTEELIEMPLGGQTCVGSGNCALVRGAGTSLAPPGEHTE